MKRPISSSSSQSDSPETKSDIIAFAISNPANRCHARLSEINEHYLGVELANVLTKRYNCELQRCAQFYSLASIFDETSTKDKHRLFPTKNMKKIYRSIQEYVLRLFICFYKNEEE